MKLRTATVFIVIAIITLFATACGGGGGGGGGDDDNSSNTGLYTDDSGYDHAFGGMTEGYYYLTLLASMYPSLQDDYINTSFWYYLSSDGSWYSYDRKGTKDYLLRYYCEGDGLYLLRKDRATKQVPANWSDCCVFVLSSDGTSFTNLSGNSLYTYSGTTPIQSSQQ